VAYVYVRFACDRMQHYFRICYPAVRFSLFQVLLPVLVVTAGTFPLLGQQFATLKITVTDPSGRSVAEAKVSVRKSIPESSAAEIPTKPGLRSFQVFRPVSIR